MRKKLTALMLTLMLSTMALCGGALAAEADLSILTPLVDLTASAAMRVGEAPETISDTSTLSSAFVYNFFLMGQQADASLGITADMLTDTAKQADYLSRVFSCGTPALSGILSTGETYDYIGVRLMSSDLSPDGNSVRLMGDLYQAARRLDALTEDEYAQVRWLDKRAVVELRRDTASPVGWKVTAFSVDAELTMEDSTQSYFASAMVEYMSSDLGFSLQYPAVFTESTLKEDATGISGQLPDGSASFFAKKTVNADAWTLEKVIDVRKQETPDAETNINEASGCGRVVTQQNGYTVADIYIVTEDWVYQAQLRYAPALAMDFSLYSDYMMNSFNADEMGIG